MWHNIQDLYKKVADSRRKEAVAQFRLATGHDCLPHRLARLGIISSDICTLCSSGTFCKHLLVCCQLNQQQPSNDLVELHWEA